MVKTAEEIGQAEAERLAGVGSGLSAEEKKAKLDEMLAKARAKKAGTSVEEEKAKEKERREGGAAIVKSKRELEDAQRKRDVEARKREKREFEIERQKLREKLAADKAAKLAEGTMVSAVKNAAASEQLSQEVPARLGLRAWACALGSSNAAFLPASPLSPPPSRLSPSLPSLHLSSLHPSSLVPPLSSLLSPLSSPSALLL